MLFPVHALKDPFGGFFCPLLSQAIGHFSTKNMGNRKNNKADKSLPPNMHRQTKLRADAARKYQQKLALSANPYSKREICQLVRGWAKKALQFITKS